MRSHGQDLPLPGDKTEVQMVLQQEIYDLKLGLDIILPLQAIGSFSRKRCILHFPHNFKGFIDFVGSHIFRLIVLICVVAGENVRFTLMNNLKCQNKVLSMGNRTLYIPKLRMI